MTIQFKSEIMSFLSQRASSSIEIWHSDDLETKKKLYEISKSQRKFKINKVQFSEIIRNEYQIKSSKTKFLKNRKKLTTTLI